jgi:hypothetical protein
MKKAGRERSKAQSVEGKRGREECEGRSGREAEDKNLGLEELTQPICHMDVFHSCHLVFIICVRIQYQVGCALKVLNKIKR